MPKADRSVCRRVDQLTLETIPYMTVKGVKRKPAKVATDEPVGIVISRGADLEKPPVLAYVWAPAPEKSDKSSESRVA